MEQLPWYQKKRLWQCALLIPCLQFDTACKSAKATVDRAHPKKVSGPQIPETSRQKPNLESGISYLLIRHKSHQAILAIEHRKEGLNLTQRFVTNDLVNVHKALGGDYHQLFQNGFALPGARTKVLDNLQSFKTLKARRKDLFVVEMNVSSKHLIEDKVIGKDSGIMERQSFVDVDIMPQQVLGIYPVRIKANNELELGSFISNPLLRSDDALSGELLDGFIKTDHAKHRYEFVINKLNQGERIRSNHYIPKLSASLSKEFSVGPYSQVRYANHGGFGAIFKASMGHREYGIKVVSDNKLARQEIDIWNLISEVPGVPKLFEYRVGQKSASGSVNILTMEWVSGRNLYELRDSMTPGDLFTSVKSAFETVNKIHEKGIVHGDIKSKNIMFDKKRGKTTILDFGESKNFDVSSSSGRELVSKDYDMMERLVNSFEERLSIDQRRLLTDQINSYRSRIDFENAPDLPNKSKL